MALRRLDSLPDVALSLAVTAMSVMLARNQRSATMNPPGVAGHTGGIRGPSPGAEVEARWRARGRRQQGQVEDLRRSEKGFR